MAVTFISSTYSRVPNGTDMLLERPSLYDTVRPVRNGDLVLVIIGVGNKSVEAATLTMPTGFTTIAPGYVEGTAVRVFFAFKYITDIDTEPTSYNFVIAASRAMVGTALVYRGALRDTLFDTILYPYGWFAPNGSGNMAYATATSQTITVIGNVTARKYTRCLSVFFINHASASPLLDDVAPLIAIRERVRTPKAAMLVADEEFSTITATTPTHTVRADASGEYIGLRFALEPIVDVADTYDNYKAKLLRSFVAEPYDTSMSTPLGKLLTVVGTIDNDIGGLMGAADFLPNDPYGAV